MQPEMLYGLVRYVLAIGAGFLVGKGYFDQGMADNLIAAVMTIVGVVWSVVEKQRTPTLPSQIPPSAKPPS